MKQDSALKTPYLLWWGTHGDPLPWGRGLFANDHAAAHCGYGSISPEMFVGGCTAMSLRALLYRRPTEPSALEIIFDKSVFLVRLRRHRQARRYTLRIDAPLREVVLSMPRRGSVKEPRDFAQQHGGWIAARLKRLPEGAPVVHGGEVSA